MKPFPKLPNPHPDHAGRNFVERKSKEAFSRIAKLWQPSGEENEPTHSTVSRYTQYLIDRLTGKAYSADELLSRPVAAADITDASTSGKAVLTGTPALGRAALELGTAATSNIFSASSYGASPTAVDSANVIAIQSALDAANSAGGGTVVLDKAGEYSVNSTLKIYSNTTFYFTPGAILKKTGSAFGCVLANSGAWTGTTDSNISLINVRVSVNSNAARDNAIVTSGLISNVSFYHVSGLFIKNFKILDLEPTLFGLQICSWTNIHLDDLEFIGAKDGLHLGTGSHGVIENLRGSTSDDLLAINAHDWLISNPTTGPISNLVIRRMVSNSSARMMCGSWAAWNTGNTYYNGERVVSSGKVYCCAIPGSEGSVSTVAPTHSSGTTSGVDGILWRFEYVGTNTETNITDITFEDCRFEKYGILRDGNNNAGYARAVTPGTEGNCYIKNLSFKRCVVDFNSSASFLTGETRVEHLSFDGCRFADSSCNAILSQAAFSIPTPFATLHTSKFIFSNCLFENTTWLGVIVNGETNWKIEVSGSGNSLAPGLTYLHCAVDRVNGFDLPVRRDLVSNPATGDRAKLRLTNGSIVPGWCLYQRKEWVRESRPNVISRRLWGVPYATASGTGSAASIYEGEQGYIDAGTTAAGYGLCRVSRYAATVQGGNNNFSTPFRLSGVLWGQAKTGGALRVLHGVAVSYNSGFSANAASETVFSDKGVGFEIAQPGGTGNQKARIIAHNGSGNVQSDWFDLGAAPASSIQYAYELASMGDGNIHLFISRNTTTTGVASIPDTPSVSLATGPTGLASGSGTGTWLVATADGTTTPTTAAISMEFTAPILTFPEL